jgi:hypothetical protein
MTEEIHGFAVEPSSSNRYLFRRVIEPRHEYIFDITAKRIVLRATLPEDVDVNRSDPLDDAERSESDAQKAAQEIQRRILGCESPSARDPLSATSCVGPNATSAALTKLRAGDAAPRFSIRHDGKAKSFFAIGAGGCARICPTANFRKAVDPVLAACGDHF